MRHREARELMGGAVRHREASKLIGGAVRHREASDSTHSLTDPFSKHSPGPPGTQPYSSDLALPRRQASLH